MGKFFMTMKYGDRRTKRFFVAFGLVLLTAAAAVAGGLFLSTPIIAFIGGGVALGDVAVLATREFITREIGEPEHPGGADADGTAPDGALPAPLKKKGRHRKKQHITRDVQTDENITHEGAGHKKKHRGAKVGMGEDRNTSGQTDSAQASENRSQQGQDTARTKIEMIPADVLLKPDESESLEALRRRFRSIREADSQDPRFNTSDKVREGSSAGKGGASSSKGSADGAQSSPDGAAGVTPGEARRMGMTREISSEEWEKRNQHYHKPMELRTNNKRSEEQERIVEEAKAKREAGAVREAMGLSGVPAGAGARGVRGGRPDEEDNSQTAADMTKTATVSTAGQPGDLGDATTGSGAAENGTGRSNRLDSIKGRFFKRRSVNRAEDTSEGDDAEQDEAADTAAAGPLRGERGTEAVFAKYSNDYVKKMIKQYKVARNYIPVIIDYAVREDVDRTPALCWVDGKDAHFLLMEAEERIITLPGYKFKKVTYEHNVPEKNMKVYENMRKSMGAYGMFADVMPTFTQTGGSFGASGFTKNLYVLGNDIAITPRSMRELNSRFDFEFSIFSAFNLREKYSEYFKSAYEKRVLWTDNVITQPEYQNAIRDVLQAMVDDDNVSTYEFDDDMELMIKYRMITKEYGDFFRNKKKEMFR